MKQIALTVGLLLFTLAGFGKSAGSLVGEGHSGDMARVLGVDLSNRDAKSRLKKITDAYAKYIDSNADELYRRIKEVEPTFSWGQEGHRIFFHWGLNGNPRNSACLAEKVAKATGGDSSRSEKIWQLVLNEQAKRNREMFAIVTSAYDNIKGDGRPAPFRHSDVNAIASLVYDTHIIGDHIVGTDKTRPTLVDLPSLRIDVVNAVRGITSGDKDFNRNDLVNTFRSSILNTTHGSPSEQAEKMLGIMVEQIPPILKKCPRVGGVLCVK